MEINHAVCDEIEPLLSRAIDGECNEREIAVVREHLKGCASCRETLRAYRDIAALIAAAFFTPRCPRVSRRREPVLRLGFFSRGNLLRLGGVAACVAFFVGGQMLGFERGARAVVSHISPVVVTTPSMWAAENKSGFALTSSVEAVEAPFTDSIEKYRAAIADELRQSNVDWLKIRELVEAMGELRTDLELFTIHLAYIDTRSGNSPKEVANHWEQIGKNIDKAAYRP